jgi:integrase
LEKFFDFLGIKGTTIEDKSIAFVNRTKQESIEWTFNNVLKFMQFQLDRANRKEITGSTVRNYLKSIKLFCEMADLSITWKKISRGLPRAKNYSDDRIPTIEEIRRLLEYPDRRLKAIIYTMASSGIRLGAWDYLRWAHIRPIEKDGKVVAAKIIVYAEEEDEYFSFISVEAYNELKSWIDYRSFSGELIDKNSWVMRDLWDTGIIQGKAFVTKPNKLATIGIKKLINRAIWAQGLRKKLEGGKKRHPFQAIHCYRKWFKTRCEIAGMKPINIEKLLSHSIGISNSYYRPTENELLEDYLKVVDLLSIDKETKLQKQLNEYAEKNNEETYIIKGKLHEKDQEITLLKKEYELTNDAFAALSDKVSRLVQEIEFLKNK